VAKLRSLYGQRAPPTAATRPPLRAHQQRRWPADSPSTTRSALLGQTRQRRLNFDMLIAHEQRGNKRGRQDKSAAESTTLEDTVAPTYGATSAQFDNRHDRRRRPHATDASPMPSRLASVDLRQGTRTTAPTPSRITNSDRRQQISFNYTPRPRRQHGKRKIPLLDDRPRQRAQSRGSKERGDEARGEDTVKPGSSGPQQARTNKDPHTIRVSTPPPTRPGLRVVRASCGSGSGAAQLLKDGDRLTPRRERAALL